MPTETVRLTIPDDEYVAVSMGHFNVFLRPTGVGALRLHVGQTAPAVDTVHYVPINVAGVSLSDLEGDDNVYLRSEAGEAAVIVIRGG